MTYYSIMKTGITLLFFCLVSLSVPAQISGRIVVDEEGSAGFINVILLEAADSNLVKGTQSELDGAFHLSNVPSGTYVLHLSGIGLADWHSETFLFEEGITKDFGQIKLSTAAIALEGVEVTAKKMLLQQSAEGTVINVGSSIMTQGSSALQVLERSPGVFIDQRNNTVSLNGQNGVGIMINGKRLRLSLQEVVAMLQGMGADNIEKIELLTSPSAKYEAAGSGGLINIVLKKHEGFGTNGSLSVSGGYGEGEKGMASARINHSAGSTYAFASYTFSMDETADGFHGVGTNVVPIFGGQVGFEILNNNLRRQRNHNLNLGVETSIGDRTIVGGSVILQRSANRNGVSNLVEYELSPDSVIRMDIRVNGNNPWDNVLTNLYLERQLAGQGKIKLDVDYLRFDSRNPTLAQSQYFNKMDDPIHPGGAFFADANRGSSRTGIDIGVFKLDFEKTFFDKLKWEAGLKGTYSKTVNLAQIERQEDDDWILDDRSITAVDLYERIGAAYTSFHYPFSSSTELTLGARYEYWERTSPEDKRFQRRLFPSLFFSHGWNELSRLQLSFTQRVTRPDYNDLASYLRYNGPLSVFTGNPLLRPTISHNLRLAYQWQAYNFSLNFIHEENPIVRYQVVENETRDLALVSPQNMFYQRNIYFQTDVPVQIQSWWSANLGFSGGFRKFHLSHTKEQIEKQYWTFNVYGSQTINLPWDLSLEISGWYNAPSYDGSRRYEGFGMLNGGLKKQLKNNQGSIQFTVDDLFKSMRIVSDFGNLAEEAFSSTADVVYRPESARTRIYRISYFRNFGNAKVKTKGERQAGAAEERSRVRSE
ncbi:MAG: TonB-dependent receptor [Saprospiraceae bacterium]|nr:TonB-dependent receptor [Saprospiraceae bacterium]